MFHVQASLLGLNDANQPALYSLIGAVVPPDCDYKVVIRIANPVSTGRGKGNIAFIHPAGVSNVANATATYVSCECGPSGEPRGQVPQNKTGMIDPAGWGFNFTLPPRTLIEVTVSIRADANGQPISIGWSVGHNPAAPALLPLQGNDWQQQMNPGPLLAGTVAVSAAPLGGPARPPARVPTF